MALIDMLRDEIREMFPQEGRMVKEGEYIIHCSRAFVVNMLEEIQAMGFILPVMHTVPLTLERLTKISIPNLGMLNFKIDRVSGYFIHSPTDIDDGGA